ncbi:hypothetical protein QFC21_003263 [Naganishia friedmannii]|uniref:Uncharacterized protein n=1 Tax=Naganishia friedmannii TaxID=89922 RepID=A0ACC2VPQ1_9TREE|nr:hypothetical protein QFC21_003263 [Naganishia friedmannii]
MSSTTYILAINCGSSSIKTKLYKIDDSGKRQPLTAVAEGSIKGIAAKGQKIKIKLEWLDGSGHDVSEQGELGDQVDYQTLPPLLLKKFTSSSKGIKDEQIKYISHRIVHGGPHKEPIIITREHEEGLTEMDTLSEFAPLHNHSAVLAIRSCLKALPEHTSLLAFDTLFHQTLPEEVYTYAIPKADQEVPIPLRKYGFHGLSYRSILQSIATKSGKQTKDVSIVVAHLGSGGSCCMIRNGESQDTTMGLTPLEGLVGGTRSGTIDPTLVFHLVERCGEDAGLDGIKVTRAEATLNKKSGLTALAGTNDFNSITTKMLNPSSYDAEDAKASTLAYKVYTDRLLCYLTFYLGKLFETEGIDGIDGLVFSGGIGEKSVFLRQDVSKRLGWMGFQVDDKLNEQASAGKEVAVKINAEASKIPIWVVQTDEEEVCAKMVQEYFDL